MAGTVAFKPSFARAQRAVARTRSKVAPRAFGETQLVISASTAVMLGIGRFAALPYQRRVAEKSTPTQNGQTHLAAGDSYAEEASFILQSNDPEGFNIVDLMAYGSLGHALGFFLLACSSLYSSGFDPKPF